MTLQITDRPGYTPKPVRRSCDEEFETKNSEHHRVLSQLNTAVSKCIVTSAKDLVRAARLFDLSDPYLARLYDEVSLYLNSTNLDGVRLSLVSFTEHFRNQVSYNNKSPDGQLVFAAMCLQDAIQDLSDGKYDEAYSNTVRCRHSLFVIFTTYK